MITLKTYFNYDVYNKRQFIYVVFRIVYTLKIIYLYIVIGDLKYI